MSMHYQIKITVQGMGYLLTTYWSGRPQRSSTQHVAFVTQHNYMANLIAEDSEIFGYRTQRNQFQAHYKTSSLMTSVHNVRRNWAG